MHDGHRNSRVTPEDEGLVYARQLMTSPGGRDYLEEVVLRPFGYVMCEESKGSDVHVHDEMGG